jgi:two-component system, NtrC family, nitrogen regulation response regulator GlnG
MSEGLNVWVVDDDHAIRWVLEKALKGAGFRVTSFPGAAELLDEFESGAPDVLLSDIRMPGVNGLELLARLRAQHPQLPIIIMTAHSDLDSAVAAYQGGAFEYLPKPFDVDEAVALVRRAAQRAQGSAESPPPAASGALLIGEAPAMQEVFRAIGRLSHSHITVLITGESGTGKELVARALHEHSPRAKRPFIAINTAAIPKDLMESEFFGHERGAFTGAAAQRRGRFEQADGGTLFLDEIGDMPADLQTRLLRVLQDGSFYRVGGHSLVKVDVRIIAATHQNLEKAVAEGRFREDLFHRLNVIRVRIPSLRERREDIPLLLRHFLLRSAQELQVEPKRLTPEVADYLQNLAWPGNVRQLENVCRWITVMAPAQEIHLQDLPADLHKAESRGAAAAPALAGESQEWPALLRQWAEQRLASGGDDLVGVATPALERTLIEVALKQTHGHRQEAAKLLGWGRNTLTRKLKELGMNGAEED